ncbi:hypothetical protein ACO0K9_07355 [Undibacterium sp. Ji50W]
MASYLILRKEKYLDIFEKVFADFLLLLSPHIAVQVTCVILILPGGHYINSSQILAEKGQDSWLGNICYQSYCIKGPNEHAH